MKYKKTFLPLIFTISTIFFLNADELKDITLVTNDWPPYHSPAMDKQGLFSRIVDEAFKASGYKLNLEYYPWNRVITLTKKGYYTGILGVFYNDEREEFFYYSDPILPLKLYIVGIHKEDVDYSTYNFLIKKDVGVTKGYFYSELFSSLNGINLVESYETVDILKKLLKGRVDYIVANKYVIHYLLRNELSYNGPELNFIEPPLTVNDLYVIISKEVSNGKDIISAFNRGLEIIKANGIYDSILLEY